MKEDVIFSARPRVEYHLNMVGAEIMNRAFRDDFMKTKRKAVILQACMRYFPKPQCKARSNGLSCECAECTPQERPFKQVPYHFGKYLMHAGRMTAFRFVFMKSSRNAQLLISAPTMFRWYSTRGLAEKMTSSFQR